VKILKRKMKVRKLPSFGRASFSASVFGWFSRRKRVVSSVADPRTVHHLLAWIYLSGLVSTSSGPHCSPWYIRDKFSAKLRTLASTITSWDADTQKLDTDGELWMVLGGLGHLPICGSTACSGCHFRQARAQTHMHHRRMKC